MKRRILYVGALETGQTSLYRYRALERLGHELIPFDLTRYKFRLAKMNALAYRLPFGPLIAKANADLVAAVQKERPKIVWLDKPTKFTAATIKRVKENGAFTVCYNQDSPFFRHSSYGPWDFYQFHKIVRIVDLHCLFRNADIPRYEGMGLNYIKIQLSYDPREQFPPAPGWTDLDRSREVSFIGSPFDERPQFLRALRDTYKLPVVISGPRWHKVFNKAEMERYLRGGMLRDAAYREAIWKSKINLAFVTQNEEDVAHKAFEIAACGGFLLALRSPGHQACFEEGREAEFFSSIEECADKIRYYLGHPAERREIAERGCERAKRSGYDNDTQLSRVMDMSEELLASA